MLAPSGDSRTLALVVQDDTGRASIAAIVRSLGVAQIGAQTWPNERMNDIETGIPPLLISAQEARQRLGIGLGLLNRLVASGDLPVVWVGGCRRFRLADLQQFVERL